MTIDERINERAGIFFDAERIRHEIVASIKRHVWHCWRLLR